MNKIISLISLGCPKNQVDTERMIASLEDAGYTLSDSVDGADIVVVNTCCFIDEAKKEAIETILEIAELKKGGFIGSIIVCGCLAQHYGNEILAQIPEIDAVAGIGANGSIASIADSVFRGEKISLLPPKEELPLEGRRVLVSPPYWAYLKIAEGCSNHCSYCVIPEIRGEYRSREMESVLEEARDLAGRGVKEVILVAQDTTAYGMDLYGEYKLPDLLKKMAEIDCLVWIRLMYCYPEKVTDELIEAIASTPKVVHYLDMPVQHINDGILSAMNRQSTSEGIKSLIRKLRERIPDIILRTTVITGFPGEGEQDFEQLAEFVNEFEFDRFGCFAFSPQQGTPAALLENALSEQEKADRCDILMNDQYSVNEAKNLDKVGNIYRVLVEGYDGYSDSYSGRSYMDAPEIDTKIIFTSGKLHEEGDFVDVEILGVSEYDLLGKALTGLEDT
ncbi:MAG TPA: 30S ribosomal protein S12 methylthiotransferase RimO [Clostridiales bacterium]|nr:MAG: Ribosomal protein S12 methylthiotransferase RimO [Firmicutes bacterium ADurb.Bin262]HOU10356.1 30S ribosomal protein S12 methylthiotransferase RimO [Clostridiales bacterium]